MFDVKRLATIDADLAGAQQGDRDAQLRLMNFHIPWLLVFARTVNDRIEEGFYAQKADPVVGEPEPTSEVENENVKDAPEDVEEGSKDSADTPEDAPETKEVEEEHVKVREGDPVSSSEPHLEADQDDSIGEDSVAAPGSPTALAEDAAIAEAEAKDVAGPGSDPLDELLVRGPAENLDAVEIEENNGEDE